MGKKKALNIHNLCIWKQTDKPRMHSFCTNTREKINTLFSNERMERSGTGKLHCPECCFPSQQGWLQAKLFLAGWQSLGAQAFGTVLWPQLSLFPAHPVLSSSILLPERGWNWYPQKRFNFDDALFFGVMWRTCDPFSLQLRYWEIKKLKRTKKTSLFDFWCLNWKKHNQWTKLAGNGWDL